jgi:hypothetical protein
MEELLQEFKVWNMEWLGFRVVHHKQPLSSEEFIKELEKKYKITKL